MPSAHERGARCAFGSGLYPERFDPTETALDRIWAGARARLSPAMETASRRVWADVASVEALRPACARLTDPELRAGLSDLRRHLVRHGLRRDLVIQAFAHLREASWRTLGLRHHPVQLLGAFSLISGKLAEMQTGEGKTIVAGLAAATVALTGTPVHVITVNDYLADRDADAVGPLLRFSGLTVGAIAHAQTSDERRKIYENDVCYVANKEIAFDYLRDRLAFSPTSRSESAHPLVRKLRGTFGPAVLRGLHFGLVDEADSILVDEARTPLILAGPASRADGGDLFPTALMVSDRLVPDFHFHIDIGARRVDLTTEGRSIVAQATRSAGGFWRAKHAREDLISSALAARHLYRRDEDYLIADGAVQIIDQHTGRIAEGRTWQNGLHQLIESIEGIATSDRHVTQVSITYQSFFRRYLKLAGMSGTLADVAGEIRLIYDLSTVRIPTHQPVKRRERGVRLLRSSEAKWDAVVQSTREITASGRSVLIGTRTVTASERLSRHLAEAGLPHAVLNARHDSKEAAIVAEAGRAGRITIVTAMAGRGTDIRLDDRVIRSGGLHVILTELHESRRTDRQLIGRGGRQGDPSTFELCISLDDDLFRIFAPRWTAMIIAFCSSGMFRLPVMAGFLRCWAQGKAERRSRRARKLLLCEDRNAGQKAEF